MYIYISVNVNLHLLISARQAYFGEPEGDAGKSPTDIKTLMAKVAKTLEPQQERSRESLRKLLKATTEVLGQHGVDGTTIPRIAHHAGLTPGAIYRRFQDKDALLETAILRILERQEERMKIFITPETAAQ